MVAVRVDRVAQEAAISSNEQAAVTREDAQVMFEWAQAGLGLPVRLTRIGFEVAVSSNEQASVSREDAQAMLGWGQSTANAVRLSRLAQETSFTTPQVAAVTREDGQVMFEWGQSTSSAVRLARMSAEIAARTTFNTVTPLPLNGGLDFFLHNWASAMVVETSYETSISASKATGAESRRALLSRPFRALRFEWQIEGRERIDRFFVQIRKMGRTPLSMPLYCDQSQATQALSSGGSTVLCNTRRRRFFTGQRVAIVQRDARRQVTAFEFKIIQSKTNDSITFASPTTIDLKRGDLILPMIDVQVTLTPEFQFLLRSPNTGQFLAQAALEVHEVPGASQLPPVRQDLPPGFPTHAGVPIFDINPDWTRGVRTGYDRQGDVYRLGKADVYDLDADRARRIYDYNLAMDREDGWRMVEFFDSRLGRARSFWLVDQDTPWSLDSITTTFVNFDTLNDFDDFVDEFEYLGIRMKDGTEYVREVVSIQEVATTWRVTVTPALPSLNIADISRAGRARRVRFSKDVLVETWLHGEAMTTTVGFIETLEEKDVSL